MDTGAVHGEMSIYVTFYKFIYAHSYVSSINAVFYIHGILIHSFFCNM